MDSFKSPTNFGDYYASRMRAWYVPPLTSNYTFYCKADDLCELYMGKGVDPRELPLRRSDELSWEQHAESALELISYLDRHTT